MAVRFRLLLLGLGAAAACGLTAPAMAQNAELTELDRLTDASADPGSAMALARNQIASGELTGAVATLERLLVDHPEADDALVLHASLLCRLDDREGARVELGELHFAISEAAWQEVVSACGAMPRPAGRGG